MSARGIVVSLHEEDFYATDENPSREQKFEVERIIMHPLYNRRNIDNDIAVCITNLQCVREMSWPITETAFQFCSSSS
jgi:hypothetical protein